MPHDQAVARIHQEFEVLEARARDGDLSGQDVGRSEDAGAMPAVRDLGRDLLHLWTAPTWQEGSGSVLTRIDCKHLSGVTTYGAPKWDSRYHRGCSLRPDSFDLGYPLANITGFEDLGDLAIKCLMRSSIWSMKAHRIETISRSSQSA